MPWLVDLRDKAYICTTMWDHEFSNSVMYDARRLMVRLEEDMYFSGREVGEE